MSERKRLEDSPQYRAFKRSWTGFDPWKDTMSDAKKPWEETWVATNVDRVSQQISDDSWTTVLEARGYGSDELSARSRLAACAPEAIRLLIEAEWAGVGDCGKTDSCPWCAEDKPWEYVREPRRVDAYTRTEREVVKCGGHADYCSWLALMRKAVVRP